MAPPSQAVYSTEHPLNWHASPDSVARMSRCVQHSSEVLFVPEGWGPGVLNTQDVVGYAVEFVFGAGRFEL